MAQKFDPNIVIFGETGVGKSSIINMILGSEDAKISLDATGCTFKSTLYKAKIRDRSYNLYDTIGLGEGSTGTVEGSRAIGNLYGLLNLLSKNGGVHLLIFVVRCGRLTQNIEKNYELFYKGFCETEVPIVVAVTGCEGELKSMDTRMDTWWTRNETFFTQAGMSFTGHACVCAYKGRPGKYGGYVNEDLVEQSKGLLEDLIACHYKKSCGWKKHPVSWLTQIWNFLLNLFEGVVSWKYIELYTRLTESGLPTADALKVLRSME